MRQFYLSADAWPAPPVRGATVRLPRDESKHLLRVLRAESGDAVRLTDGDGRILTAELVGAVDGEAELSVTGLVEDRRESAAPRLTLACGVIKGRRWEWLLEKAAELGVHRIVPLVSDHAEIDPGAGRRRRWETLLLGALKQSGRTWRPRLAEPRSLDEHLDADRDGTLCYGLARLREDTSSADVLTFRDLTDPALAAAAGGGLTWCVGPEGGWSAREVAELAAAGRAVRLGGTRQRTETAAVTGLAALAAAREAVLDAADGFHGTRGAEAPEGREP